MRQGVCVVTTSTVQSISFAVERYETTLIQVGGKHLPMGASMSSVNLGTAKCYIGECAFELFLFVLDHVGFT